MDYFYDVFNEFCQCEYEHFNEMLSCNNLKMTYINRTSSFYIEHEHFDLFSLNYASDFEGKTRLEKLELLILNEINQLFDINDITLSANSIMSVNEEYLDHADINMLAYEIESTTDILKDLKCQTLPN